MVEGTRIRIDGQPETCLPADDRGLAYGDGVFRTLAIDDGAIVAWAFQYHRLATDCRALAIAAPPPAELADELARVSDGIAQGVAKILVTRGSGGRGYTPPEYATPRVIVMASHERPAVPDSLTLPIAETCWAEQPLFAGIKHLNRLEQVWARAECRRREQADLAVTDTRGRLCSTTLRNLFLCDASGHWYTPALSRCGIAGATRARLLHAAEQAGQAVVEQDIALDDIVVFQAAIACNALSGAIPVMSIGGHDFTASPAMARCAGRWLARTA